MIGLLEKKKIHNYSSTLFDYVRLSLFTCGSVYLCITSVYHQPTSLSTSLSNTLSECLSLSMSFYLCLFASNYVNSKVETRRTAQVIPKCLWPSYYSLKSV